jgi:hypothetical protein
MGIGRGIFVSRRKGEETASPLALLLGPPNRTLVIPSNFVKFDIIWLNFDWSRFCTVKTQKPKNQLNLPINRTELAENQSNSSKIRWNSRGY